MPIEFVSPDGDVTTNWDSAVPDATHYSGLDDPKKEPADGQFIRTITANDDDRFTLADPPGMGGGDEVFQCFGHIRAQINDPAATAKLQLELIHTSSTSLGTKDVTAADLGGYGVIGDKFVSWTILALTQAETNSLEIVVTLLAS